MVPASGETTQSSTAAAIDRLEPPLRAVISIVGVALLVAGVVYAFEVREGVGTAALLAVGFALVVVGYAGRSITRVKFRDFEIELERVTMALKRVEDAASKTLDGLRTVSRSYEAVRQSMRSGGRRDSEMERNVTHAMRLFRTADLSIEQLEEDLKSPHLGDRILVLAAMKENPDLRTFEMVLDAIEHPHRPFDHDRFLVLAGEMLGDLNYDQRTKLRETVERQRASGKIKPGTIRWLTSERLLRLLARWEDSRDDAPIS